MSWPDIFFKAKKRPPEPQTPPSVKPVPESAKAAAVTEPQPPTVKPIPAVLGPQAPTAVPSAKMTASLPAQAQAGTRTLPAMHGVVLRPPTRLTSTTMPLPSPAVSSSTRATAPLKNIEQLMAEADPVSTLNQTGSLHLKPLSPDATAPKPEVAKTPAEPVQAKKESTPPKAIVMIPPFASSAPSASAPPAPSWTPPPFPAFQPANGPATSDVKKPEPPPVNPVSPAAKPVIIPGPPVPQPPAPSVMAKVVPAPPQNDTPFILKPATTTTPAASTVPPSSRIVPPPPPPTLKPMGMPEGSIFRRRAKMTDLAKIVLPPKREDTQVLHPPTPPASSPTVVPSAFPVAAMTARASQPLAKAPETAPVTFPAPVENTPAPLEKIVTDQKLEEPPPFVPPIAADTPVAKTEEPFLSPPIPKPEIKAEAPITEKLPEITKEPVKPVETEKPAMELPPTPPPFIENKIETTIENKPAPAIPDLGIEPKVDPEAHKSTSATPPEPKVDPEAHKPEPKPAEIKPDAPASTTAALDKPRERREFHLANGERVAGVVLSETPDAVYIEHGTLGVLTIPRAQIAKRLVEIILINGDRIVGDIMAETADTLYVRHASLGMLTVPRAQRSTRVVEAILNDGDRILGEVLSETETFTVIRSATLGTITVPHNKVSMLNRKIEQIELKSLPPAAPELKDKPSA